MIGMDALDRLIKCLGRLPGIGRRSAERMAVRLVRDPGTLMPDLIGALQDAANEVRCCSLCGSVTRADRDPCRLCADASRDGSVVCVVEDPADIDSIERSGGFRGRYHALMGKLSPARSQGVEDLRVAALMERVEKEGFREVVLALSTDVEGDSTCSFIAEQLKGSEVKISRLALGLPAGSGVAYSDPVTLARAMKGRVTV